MKMRLRETLREGTVAIGSFLYPRRCHICGVTLDTASEYICPLCESRLPRTYYHRRDMNPMEQRFAGLFPFEHASGHFFYSAGSEISSLVQDFKYRKFRGLARHLGRLMARELIITPFLSDIDAIIPVPMHFMKKARRGYNQTEEIAAGISEETGIPVYTNLKASKPHSSQTHLSPERRRQNTKDIFTVSRPEQLTGAGIRHILLLDDICTTGATLTSASSAIHASLPDIRLSLLTLGVTF